MSQAEHDRVYATPGLPGFEIHELDERLLAGRNPLTVVDVNALAKAGVTHVLDLREEKEWRAPGKFGGDAVAALAAGPIERAHMPVVDTQPPSADVLTDTVAWIARALEADGSRVFVHCRAGRERTATVLAAYLARHEGFTVEQALDWLRGKYGGRPLREQERALRRWIPGAGDPAAVAYRSRVRGCVLGGAIGDALGAPVEFMGLAAIRARFGPAGVRGYESKYGRRGAFTDDTQMTLFTLEGLIRAHVRGAENEICHPPSVVWHAYRRWLVTQDGPAPGNDASLTSGWMVKERALHSRREPGNTCLSALRTGEMGTREHVLNDSKGCGGVMRVAPCGLLPAWSAEVAFEMGCDVAAITHSHPSGYLASGAMAYLVRRALDGDALRPACDDVLALLATQPRHEETSVALRAALDLADRGAPTAERIERLGAGWIAEEALAMGVYAALTADDDDMRSALLLAVNHSGDSDSTGAIAGNLLGVARGVAALPGDLLGDVELRRLLVTVSDDLMHEMTLTTSEHDPAWRVRYPGS